MTDRRYLLLVRPSILDGRCSGCTLVRVTGNDPFRSTDPIGEALFRLRLTGTFYCRSELTGPWGLTLPDRPGCLWFHIVTVGRCLLEVGNESRMLRPGDVALVPHGRDHILRDEPGTIALDVVDLEHEYRNRYATLRHGGGGAAATMVCGAVRLDHPAAHNLLPLLPEVIHLESSLAPRTERMQSTLRLVAIEAAELRSGGEAVITRLSDILVIQTLRDWIEYDPAARRGWLGALRDHQISRAISSIHRDPARDWTVASLANESAMSRSAFAARFTDLVDEPVMRYVTRWRMQVARSLLIEEDLTVADVARRLGYQSEAAFSRAFKRMIGVSPGLVGRPCPGEWRAGGHRTPALDVVCAGSTLA